MNIRVEREKIENYILSEFAMKSTDTKGRDFFEQKCDIRTEFQRDRDRILHSKAFRRMKHKTQVFISPEGDHYRTRLTHTLEVSQIARTISRALRLNEDLTEAIALGHDLGHTPFGHSGERILNSLSPFGFEHNVQSVRVVEILENDGKGLNLTVEVRDGILNHRTRFNPSTLEGKVVRLSDKIAYINHDIDDAIRGGILKESDIPKDITDVVGKSFEERINSMIHNTVENSIGINDIKQSDDMAKAVYDLRKYLFTNVYMSDRAKKEEEKTENMIKILYEYYCEKPYKMSDEFKRFIEEGIDVERVVCDYIACMTDRFAIKKFIDISIPKSWNIY